MDAIEKRARELLAVQYPGDCGYETREWIMEGKYGDAEAIAAIIAALTPPEGYVLVPVVPTQEMLSACESQWVVGSNVDMARREWAAMIAARPEVS